MAPDEALMSDVDTCNPFTRKEQNASTFSEANQGINERLTILPLDVRSFLFTK